MAVLDGAIANVALPTIATDLNASPAGFHLDSQCLPDCHCYLLLSLSFLGDMIGYHRIYKAGLVVFTLASLFCAFFNSLEMLTLARILQGFGGAALMSVNTALIRLIYPQRQLGRGMGINSFVVAVSSAAGPTIAAAICRWLPGSGCSLLTCRWGLLPGCWPCASCRRTAPAASPQRFDLPSAVMNALTFGLLITALSSFAQGQSTKWCCWKSLGCW
ncbi:MFS transporter [Escherichia coli]